jgi:hypothetical protein
MAIVPYTQWLPYVQVNVPDCPKALIVEAIRQKVIEFCQRSLFLRQELDGFYTVADDNEYDLSPPVDTNIAQLLMLKVNKRELEPKTQDDLEEIYQEWRDQSGEPSYFFLKNTNTAILVPRPIGVYPVRILVALKPTQAAQGVDESIFEEYKDAIKHGALAYLMLMAEKTWSNPNMSAFYQSQFESSIQESKMRAEKGYALRKTFRVKAHYI